jgi:hypothetical protein
MSVVWADCCSISLNPAYDLINNIGSASVLLFPDWCNQCVAMGSMLVRTAHRLD